MVSITKLSNNPYYFMQQMYHVIASWWVLRWNLSSPSKYLLEHTEIMSLFKILVMNLALISIDAALSLRPQKLTKMEKDVRKILDDPTLLENS